jgi:hypothetical protein
VHTEGEKKFQNKFAAKINNSLTLHSHQGHGCVAQLNRASDYGSEGFRFES